MLRIVSGLMLLIVTTSLWALSEARLINQSSTGQTALFNLGTQDGFREGEYAVIVKQIRELEKRDLRIALVAKARNIKLNTDSSVWVLYKIYDPELLVKNDKFLVLSESNTLSGRGDPTTRRLNIVVKKGDAPARTKNALADDRDRLGKLTEKYQTISEAKEAQKKSDVDFELIDLAEWERAKGERYRVALYKSPHKEEFRRNYRLETFHKLVAGYLKRVNDPDFNYESFYEEQMRDDFSSEFRKKGSMYGEYETFLRNQSVRAGADAKLYRALLEKGEGWSEDFSDEELRVVLQNVSVLQEADRKKLVMAKPLRYTALLDYGRHLSDAQSDNDPLYRRDSRYSLEGELEATPFLKHETLERFTLTASLRSNRNAFAAGGYNADFNEYSVSAGINWYPMYVPYDIETPVLFLGAYVRGGLATTEVPTLNQRANYNVFSMPGLRTGVRYNLRNKVGLRINASMETLTLERYDTNTSGSVLDESVNLVEGKIGFAVAYSF